MHGYLLMNVDIQYEKSAAKPTLPLGLDKFYEFLELQFMCDTGVNIIWLLRVSIICKQIYHIT